MAFETINLGNQPTGTGGDTARSAFEKVNKNFINAEVLASSMSQAQFEAIRAQNNEKYAASGFVHFGKHVTATAVNEGLTVVPSVANTFWLGIHDAASGRGGNSKTNNPLLNISGIEFNLDRLSQTFEYLNAVKLPQVPDGKTTYNKSTGANIVYATTTAAFNAAAVDVNLEVVTDRVDMWGFESWLEEVSATNPYVYPNGLIQSLATTMDGIATVSSNRPVTYYAWFAGDTGSKGKGVNYFTLTDAQKRKVLSNYKNKLYFLDDGRLVQWRVRGRSFAGAGNGDWSRIESQGPQGAYPSLASTANTRVMVQGLIDAVAPYGDSLLSGSQFRSYESSGNAFQAVGLFTALSNENQFSFSVSGECYFLVCGTVNRLNQGAYHPSFNPSGTASWASTQQAYWCCNWFNGDSRTKASGEPTDKASCFTGQLGSSNGGFGNIGTKAYDGYGRPDGRFYDAIYASGQGGVCRDIRYSANHTTLEKFAEADSKVKGGTYRGFEKRVFSNVFDATYISGTLASEGFLVRFGVTKTPINAVGGHIFSLGVARKVVRAYADGADQMVILDGTTGHNQAAILILKSELINSVGGLFLQADVVGNPSDILLTNALKNGWEGSWIPVTVPATDNIFPATRKSLDVPTRVRNENNAATWVSGSSPFNSSSNTISHGFAGVAIFFYQAFAKQTEDVSNFDIYGGFSGVGSVFSNIYYSHFYGALLGESLIGKISTSPLSSTGVNSSLAILDYTTASSRGRFDPASYAYPKHSPLTFGVPASGLVGYKALDYNVNISQQAFKQYAYAEIISDGTDWGDDSLIAIVNGKTYKNDLNGKSVVVGTAKLKEPIGWIKNTI